MMVNRLLDKDGRQRPKHMLCRICRCVRQKLQRSFLNIYTPTMQIDPSYLWIFTGDDSRIIGLRVANHRLLPVSLGASTDNVQLLTGLLNIALANRKDVFVLFFDCVCSCFISQVRTDNVGSKHIIVR